MNDMNDDNINVGTRRSVVAMVKEDGKLKGIELRKDRGSVEILWAKSAESSDIDWQSFALRCGLSATPTPAGDAESGKMVVIGFSSAGTVFHRTSVPPVEDQEIASIVQLQAETRLPLPADQTELAWRADPAHNGQIGVTMVVARKELLQRFAGEVRSLDPAKILLDCEGIVEAWRTIFSEREDKAIIISMGARSTQVCLAEHGRLSNAVILDMGIEDFSAHSGEGQAETDEKVALDLGLDNLSARPHEEQTEATERFARDMRSVVELFGYTDQEKLPVFVLSDNNAIYVHIVSSLRSADLNARIALPDTKRLTGPGDSGAEWLYEYRAPIGLALMALEDGYKELNIFEHVYTPADQQEKKHWLYSPKLTGAIAAVMIALCGIVCYAIDMKSPQAMETRLETAAAEADMGLDELVERQRLIKMVARERPDILVLLKLVNASGERGVVLNSMHFRKDQKVSIMGQVQNNDQLYKLHENLRKNKDLSEVKIQSTGKVSSVSSSRSSSKSGSPSPPKPGGAPSSRASGPGSRGKGGVTFTITFHYKNFTKKTARSAS